MKTEESIVGHAQAESPAFEEAAQASLLLRLQVVPLGSVFFVSPQRVPKGISMYYKALGERVRKQT